MLQSHPELQAIARLMSLPELMRSLSTASDFVGHSAQPERLLQRLFSKLFTNSTSLLFLGQANDLFVSEHRLRLMAPERSTRPQFIIVACDHFTYFGTPAGRQGLMQALANNR